MGATMFANGVPGQDSEIAKNLGSKNFGAFIAEGEAILRYQERLIDEAVRHAVEIELDGHKVLSANVTSTSLISEVCGRLAQDRAFAATYFMRGADKKRVWSLRSRPPHGIDVSEVARRHGGGGHASAAGFTEEIG